MKRVWLKEFYRQWAAARGKQIKPSIRSFRRKWQELLDAAGLHSAEDQKAAQREAEAEESQGHLKLHRLKGRKNIIQKIELPLVSESWLLKSFNHSAPAESLAASLAEIEKAETWPHQRFPDLWKTWCNTLKISFRTGKIQRPLDWRSPDTVRTLLETTYRLTSLEWREGALVREVSVEIGLKSKDLERRRRAMEACLRQMFRRQMPLQSLGIILTDSRSDLAGVLTLHFPNQEVQVFDKLKEIFSLSLGDLERAEYATTPAKRLLTVENSKTTLRRLAVANADTSTLLAACSFPTKALLRLLDLLPKDLPVYHFGDTDPAGFHILSKLRETSKRPVVPFLMRRRPVGKKCDLSEYDQALLPRLLGDSFLRDVHGEIEAMRETGCKGDFEQETIGLPDLAAWPFFSRIDKM